MTKSASRRREIGAAATGDSDHSSRAAPQRNVRKRSSAAFVTTPLRSMSMSSKGRRQIDVAVGLGTRHFGVAVVVERSELLLESGDRALLVRRLVLCPRISSRHGKRHGHAMSAATKGMLERGLPAERSAYRRFTMLPGALDDAGSLAGNEPRIASSINHSSCRLVPPPA